jgi:hypothetical protein
MRHEEPRQVEAPSSPPASFEVVWNCPVAGLNSRFVPNEGTSDVVLSPCFFTSSKNSSAVFSFVFVFRKSNIVVSFVFCLFFRLNGWNG